MKGFCTLRSVDKKYKKTGCWVQPTKQGPINIRICMGG